MYDITFEVAFKSIEDAPNILFLNEDADEISKEEFIEDMNTGYRAALLLIPVSNGLQTQVAMSTPYHRDSVGIDPGFVIGNYNEFLRVHYDSGFNHEVKEFQIGEITNE